MHIESQHKKDRTVFPGWYVLRWCLLYHFQRSKHVRHRRLRFAVFTTITSPQMLMAKYGLEVSWQFLRNQWGSKAVVIVYKWWFNGHIIWYKQQYHIISLSYHYHIISGCVWKWVYGNTQFHRYFFPSTIGIRGTHIFWNWETAISRTLNMKIPVVNFTFTISIYIYIYVYIYIYIHV